MWSLTRQNTAKFARFQYWLERERRGGNEKNERVGEASLAATPKLPVSPTPLFRSRYGIAYFHALPDVFNTKVCTMVEQLPVVIDEGRARSLVSVRRYLIEIVAGED
jgi:hypothetical protein